MRLMGLHERHHDVVWREVLNSRELPLGSFGDLPALSSEELEEMRETFGSFGTRSWTGQTTYTLHKSVRDAWGDENERVLLDHIAAVNLRYSNLRLHSTAVSLVRPALPEDGGVIYEAGESNDDIAASLLISFWAFAHSVRLVIADPYRTELMAFYYERMPSFFQAEPEPA